MAKKSATNNPKAPVEPRVARLDRPLSLLAQVELALRQAIADNRFPNGKLPTEVVLGEQLGVSRETVRLATETLQAEGLLVKIRRRGTFLKPTPVNRIISRKSPRLLGYIQTNFYNRHGLEEVANREISSLMLQGALSEASNAGYTLEVQHTAHTKWREVTNLICDNQSIRGLILASYAEEKTLRRLIATGMPIVLLDEETKVPQVHSVRDDSIDGGKQAVRHLTKLGHRRIAYAHWGRIESNNSRLLGYHEGLREAGLTRHRQWEFECELTSEGAASLVDQFLAISPRPSAIYCFNNTFASLVITEFQRRKLRVPEDIAVFGAGGERFLNLTCHQADWYNMGRLAVGTLIGSLKKNKSTKSKYLLCRHKLILGETTAPLRVAK